MMKPGLSNRGADRSQHRDSWRRSRQERRSSAVAAFCDPLKEHVIWFYCHFSASLCRPIHKVLLVKLALVKMKNWIIDLKNFLKSNRLSKSDYL
jgi:hypothetical protein